MKFKLTNKVSSFLHNGKRYFPGDIVDLPPRYAKLNWLEPVKKPKPAPPKEASTELESSKEKSPQPKK